MLEKLKLLEANAIKEAKQTKTLEKLLDVKNKYIWKKWKLTEILKWVKDLSIEDKKTIWKFSNDLKKNIALSFENQAIKIEELKIQKEIENFYEDVTIPSKDNNTPNIHPYTEAIRDVISSFERMWFKIFESRELVSEYENFDALNVPKTHPARDMQDTFWIQNKEKVNYVLATQCTSMDNWIYKTHNIPLKAAIIGRVCRNEDIDATHEATFYQVDWIVVDKNISLANLKYTIKAFLSDLFKKEVDIRMRPWYFPFVEPWVEVDFSCTFCEWWEKTCRVCKWSWWIEFMWAGLSHPKVLKEWNIDPEKYTWFAFWFWLSRLVMIKYGIDNIRHLMWWDIRFLKQF